MKEYNNKDVNEKVVNVYRKYLMTIRAIYGFVFLIIMLILNHRFNYLIFAYRLRLFAVMSVFFLSIVELMMTPCKAAIRQAKKAEKFYIVPIKSVITCGMYGVFYKVDYLGREVETTAYGGIGYTNNLPETGDDIIVFKHDKKNKFYCVLPREIE